MTIASELQCGGAGPSNISEELLAMTAANATSVTVGWMKLTEWAVPRWPFAEEFALATSFPRVEVLACSSTSSSAAYECALHGYASKSVVFLDVRRDRCYLSAAADIGVHGYCFGAGISFLMQIDDGNKQFLAAEFASVSPLPIFKAPSTCCDFRCCTAS